MDNLLDEGEYGQEPWAIVHLQLEEDLAVVEEVETSVDAAEATWATTTWAVHLGWEIIL
jgi:hypothetical protein